MAWWLLCAFLLGIIDNVSSFSACDELDVTFVVDTDTIINDPELLIYFITRIINDGSSEQTGFSVVVYGDNIPNDLDIKLITLEETQDITQRAAAEAQVEDILADRFATVIFNHQQGIEDGKAVGLLEAFKIGNEQHIPPRSRAYKTKLGYDVNDPRIGANDDEKLYFIYDFDNKLMNDDMDDICVLFKHLDTNQIENDDEKIYFFMGQEFVEHDIRNIKCNNKSPSQITKKKHTFFEFEENLLFNDNKMEEIFDITCPAKIESKKYGNLNLGNHVQWIDLETVIKCSLKYYDFNDKTKQDQLDITQSYIQVKDYLNDDNTFKRNDYLLSSENIFEKMKKKGCTAPVTKIEKIKTGKKIYNKGDKKKEYQILKLYLTLPQSPMEYILDAKVKGDVGVHVDDEHIDSYNNAYNSAYNDEFYGVSIEPAGIEYMNSLNEDDLNQYIHAGVNKAITYINTDDEYAAKWFNGDGDDEYDDEYNNDYYDDYYNDELYDDQNVKDYYKFMDEYSDEDYDEYEQYDDYYGYNDRFDDGYDDDDNLREGMEYENIYDFFNLEKADFDDFDMNQMRALYQIFDEYMSYRYGLDWYDYYDDEIPGWDYLSSKASQAWNYGKKKTSQAYNYGKKKASQAYNYGKKKFNEAYDYGKKKVKQAKDYVVKKVDQWTTIKRKGTRKLADLSFKGDYKWEKKGTAVKNIKTKKGMRISFKGKGSITLRYGYWFKFKMSVSFNFFWKILSGEIHIEFKLHGGWEVGAYFNAKLRAQLEVTMKNILNYGKTFTFRIGPVPMIIRPYITLDAKIKTLPLEVYAGIRCKYAQKFAVGYIYNRKKGKSKRISERKTVAKGCTKELKINEYQNKGQQCPVAKLGFNVYIQPKIGAELYHLINVALGFQFVIPFRITMPEKNLKLCGKTGDFCNTADKKLFASFTVSMHLNILGYAKVDTSVITSIIKNLIRGKSPKPKRLAFGKPKKIASKIKIIGRKSLGCKKLTGLLAPLNKHYRSKCCKGGGRPTTAPPTTVNVRPKPTTAPTKKPGKKTKSPTKPGDKTKSPTKPGEKTKSPTKPGKNTKSPTKPEKITKSPTKPGEKTKSPTKPGEKTKSPTKPGEKTKSPTKPEKNTKSPTKPGEKTKSPTKPGEKTKSPTKPETNTKSPTKPGEKTKSPTKPGSETKTPTKPGYVTKSPTKKPGPGKCDAKFERITLKRYTKPFSDDYKDPNNMGVCIFSVKEQVKKGHTQISKNFKLKEFAIRGDILRLSPQIVNCVQAIRTKLRSAVVIHTGYLSVAYSNKKRKEVGHPKKYQPKNHHQSGTATDISSNGIAVSNSKGTHSKMWRFAKIIICQCRPMFLRKKEMDIGLGLATTYIHVEMRRKSDHGFVSWTYDPKVHGKNEQDWKHFIENTWKACPR